MLHIRSKIVFHYFVQKDAFHSNSICSCTMKRQNTISREWSREMVFRFKGAEIARDFSFCSTNVGCNAGVARPHWLVLPLTSIKFFSGSHDHERNVIT
jgi:hypothetical protein